jgi:hypothetical protein
MSSYGGNKVVGWGEGLPEGTQVPTLTWHIGGNVPTLYLRSMMSMNVLKVIMFTIIIEYMTFKELCPVETR